jgi:type II secretory pathway component PulF
MPWFRYHALNAEQQIVVGYVDADGVQQAIVQLEAAGLAVQSIGFASAEAAVGEAAPVVVSRRTPLRDPMPLDASVEQDALQSHLERVIQQSQPIVPALRAFAAEMPPGEQREQLLGVCRILEGGDPRVAAAALTELPEYWIPLLSAAASASDPARVLHDFLVESRRADQLRRQWRVTLAYPTAILILAAAILVAFSFLIIPMFRDMFDDFGLDLPDATSALLKFSEFITNNWAFLLIILAAAALAAFGRRRILPASWREGASDFFGSVFGRSTAIARFARFTADLLDAGLSVPDALRIAGFTSRRPPMRRAGWRLANEIEAGRGGSRQAFEGPLTATMLYALQANVSPAARVRLLKELSGAYADRAERWWSWTRGVVEPLAILLIGGVVLMVVFALFLPLIDLINNLSG